MNPSLLLPLIARRSREALPSIAYITMLGSSTTQRNSTYNLAGNTFAFNSEGVLTWTLRYLGQRLSLIRDMRAAGVPTAGQYHFGFPSQTLRQIIDAGYAAAAVDACSLAPGGAALCIQAPRNDLGAGVTSAVAISRVQEVMTLCKVAKVPFILFQDPPRLAGTGEAAILVQRQAYNAAVVTLAAAEKCGLVLCGSVSEDAGNPGYADPALYDPTIPGHMLTPTVERVGRMVAELMPLYFRLPEPIDLMTWIDSPNNLLGSRSYMTGGSAGVMPTGWSRAGSGSATATINAPVSFGDGTGRFWSSITVTGGTTNARGVEVNNSAALTGFIAGDTVVALALYQFPTASGWTGAGFDTQALNSNSFRIGYDGLFYYAPANPPAAIDRPTVSLMTRTMPVTIPASNTPYYKTLMRGNGTFLHGSALLLKNPSELPGWREHWEYNP